MARNINTSVIDRLFAPFREQSQGWTTSSILERLFNGLARIFFGLTLVFLPFRYAFLLLDREILPIYREYTDFQLFPSDLTLGLTVLFWILACVAGNQKPTLRPKVLTLLIGALTIGSVFSAFSSVDPSLSAYHSLRLFLLFGFYLYIINEIQGLDQLILPVGIQVFLQAVIGIAQVTGQKSVGLDAFGEHTLEPTMPGVSVVLVQGERILRAYGLTDHPNLLGGVLAFSLLIVSGWLITRRLVVSRFVPAWLLLVVGTFSVGLLGLFMTYSRSGWLALTGGFALLFYLAWKTGGVDRAQPLFGLALMGILIVSPFIIGDLDLVGSRLNFQRSMVSTAHEGRSLPERAILIQAGNKIFLEAPLTGIGLGAFPQALKQAEPEFPYHYQPPHLVVLLVAAETGILVALVYSVLLIWPWLAGLLQRKAITFSPALITAYAVLLAVSLVGLFDYYPWLLQPGRLWLWLSWGLWGAVYVKSRDGRIND